MKIHLIAVGGSVMHNLALALKANGHSITGSDDEIYDPARGRLLQSGLLPEEMGWNQDRIHDGLDAVIVGKHARADNPELMKAQQLGLKIYSFPSFVAEMSKNKKRIVIAGSHGKTSTTSIVMHVAKYCGLDFDYLVGAQLEGFDHMVKLSDAPFIIIEGDEYLTSPLDDRPKFLHYKPHASAITGIAWDHMNVFPTFENYVDQFRAFVDSTESTSKIYFYEQDPELIRLALKYEKQRMIPYNGFSYKNELEGTSIVLGGKEVLVPIFGAHNMQNLEAAYLLCTEMGISMDEFGAAVQHFQGPSKRMEKLRGVEDSIVYIDFAHAPSKVKATLNAVLDRYKDYAVIACLELHTYSSLNKDFLPQYKDSLNGTEQSVVLYDPHALKMKKMADLDKKEVQSAFGGDVIVFDDPKQLEIHLNQLDKKGKVFLMMSSGPWGGLNLRDIFK
jgi:UDP-N-acetylmuramate: L-alanyl-gamma-D-glutamyl-meso-diaminopimelate ligase